MTRAERVTRRGLGAAAVALLAACGKAPQPVADDLARDLAAARSQSVELAGAQARGVQVVSATELTGAAPRAAAPAPTRVAPRRQPQRATPRPQTSAPDPAPEPVEAAEAPTPAEAETPAPTPATTAPIYTPRPQPAQPAPPGGYKSTGEVIRNAPFPINP